MAVNDKPIGEWPLPRCRSALGATLEIARLMAVLAFYLLCNFYIFMLPVGAYYAWRGAWLPRALALLTLFDYLYPLRPGPKGLWVSFAKLTDYCSGLAHYFNAELIVEGTFERERNYLMVYHPHGLFGIAHTLYCRALHETYGTCGLFTGADVIFLMPLLRRLMTWWGCSAVTAGPLRRALRYPWPHNMTMLQPGGVSEMFYGTDREQIILGKRKGFCKICLQTGASIVPCYVLGANEVFTRYFGPSSLLARLSSLLRVSLVPWGGRWGIPFGVVPNKCKLVVAVGQPIHVAAVEEPTREQVEALHAQYVAALRSLFDRHKGRMGADWMERRGTLFLEDETKPKAA